MYLYNSVLVDRARSGQSCSVSAHSKLCHTVHCTVHGKGRLMSQPDNILLSNHYLSKLWHGLMFWKAVVFTEWCAIRSWSDQYVLLYVTELYGGFMQLESHGMRNRILSSHVTGLYRDIPYTQPCPRRIHCNIHCAYTAMFNGHIWQCALCIHSHVHCAHMVLCTELTQPCSLSSLVLQLLGCNGLLTATPRPADRQTDRCRFINVWMCWFQISDTTVLWKACHSFLLHVLPQQVHTQPRWKCTWIIPFLQRALSTYFCGPQMTGSLPMWYIYHLTHTRQTWSVWLVILWDWTIPNSRERSLLDAGLNKPDLQGRKQSGGLGDPQTQEAILQNTFSFSLWYKDKAGKSRLKKEIKYRAYPLMSF